MRTESFDVADRAGLALRVPSGDVSVETGLEGRIELELVPLRDDDATREAIENAQVGIRPRKAGGDEVYVEVQKRFGWLGRGPRIGVKARCPRGTHLECMTASADVVARGSYGDVAVKTASGDVLVDEVAGTLAVHTASGDARADSVGGDAALHGVSGDVIVGRVGGALAGHTVSGDLIVGPVEGEVTVNTVSGDVQLEEVAASARIQAVSGDVRVAVRPGLRVFIDASSVSGSMRSELDVESTPPAEEGPVVELRAKTVSGDVTIARARVGARA